MARNWSWRHKGELVDDIQAQELATAAWSDGCRLVLKGAGRTAAVVETFTNCELDQVADRADAERRAKAQDVFAVSILEAHPSNKLRIELKLKYEGAVSKARAGESAESQALVETIEELRMIVRDQAVRIAELSKENLVLNERIGRRVSKYHRRMRKWDEDLLEAKSKANGRIWDVVDKLASDPRGIKFVFDTLDRVVGPAKPEDAKPDLRAVTRPKN